MTCDRFLTAAQGIARQIRTCIVRARDGSLVWCAPQPETDRPATVGPFLYDGVTGIVLFLAALESATRSGELRELCLTALAPLRRKLSELADNPARADRLGVGGFVGLGSLIYAFVRIGRWLDEPLLVEEGYRLIDLITPERIARDERPEIIYGSAGALLALLTAAEETQEPASATASLEAARICARHLLSRRSSQGDGWPWAHLPASPGIAGFAHGAAGICHALLRLYGKTGEQELLANAREGLAFERSLFVPECRNWRDARVQGLRFKTSWCHGAPGIGLGRLASLDVDESRETRAEIAAALATTRDLGLADNDSLCCGNAGLAEILLYGYQRLGDPGLLAAANALADQMLRRAESLGHVALPSGPAGDLFNPTLLGGVAGIGFTLLRLARPHEIPSALLLG